MIKKNRARNKSSYSRKSGKNSYYASFGGLRQRVSYTSCGREYMTSISMCTSKNHYCVYECSTTEYSKGSLPR